jgi:hypothetical protein
MLAFITNPTSAVLPRKLVRSLRSARRPAAAALELLVQAGGAIALIAVGFVVPLPSFFGAWQHAVQYAVSFLWIMGMISAIKFVDRSEPTAAPHVFRTGVHLHRRADHRR